MRRRSRLSSALAVGGMVLVLGALTTCALWGVTTTQAAARHLQTDAVLNDAFQQARQATLIEAALHEHYAREVTLRSDVDQPLTGHLQDVAHRAAATLTAMLGIVSRTGGADDRALVVMVLPVHQRYAGAFAQVVAAATRGDRRRVEALMAHTVEPLADRIDAALVGPAAAHQRAARASLQALQRTQEAVRIIAVVVFLLGLALLALVARIAHLSQRRTLEAAIAHHAQEALTDHLTGLGNHRAFEEDLPRALALAHRHATPLALALLDLDDFKVINDQQGHGQGDRVLAELGAVLRGSRAEDRAFRLGGDEFALLLPQTTAGAAIIALERLRRAVEAGLWGATVSIGISALEPGERAAIGLRDQADAALYEAKRRGRNTLASFAEIKDTVALTSPAPER